MKLTKHEAEEYKRCAADPLYTLNTYGYLKDIEKGKIRWPPYDWQIDLIGRLFRRQNVIILKSRQVGASWTIAFYVAWLIHFRPDIEILLLSQSEKKAIKLLAKVKFICVNLPDFIRREFNADSRVRLSVVHRRTDGAVSSESSVDSLTTTGSSARGDTAYFIFMDELGHMENDEEVYEAVKPATSRGGQMAIASSPNGPEGVFARIWMLSDGGEISTYYPMRVHYTDCGFDEEWLEEVTAGMTDESVLQEYELSFIGGGSPAFDPQHLNSCFIPMEDIVKGGDSEIEAIRSLVANSKKFATGVDTAEIKAGRGKRKRDYNAITSLNEYGIQIAAEANKMLLDEWAGKTVSHGGKQFEVVGYVSKWHKEYPGTMFIEENGPGHTVENRHVLPSGGMSYMAVKRTTGKRKQRLVDQFRLAIAGQQVIVTDRKTWYQLTLYQDLGGGKYSAPAGSYDDLVIAILEAWDALISMGGYEFVMPQLEKAGAYELFSDGDLVDVPRLPSPDLDPLYDIVGPAISVEEWHEFLPTEENLAVLNSPI